MRTMLEAQNAILESIVTRAPLEDVLTRLCLEVEALHPGILVSVLILEGDALHDGAGPSLPAAYRAALEGLPIGESGGSCGAAVVRRQRVIVEDVEVDPCWASYREVARQHGLRACWSTPILSSKGEVLGTFALYARHPRRPTDREVASVDAFSHLAAIAIERARTAAALEEEKERYRALVDQIPGAVYRCEVAHPRRFSFVSPAILELTGHPASAFLDDGLGWAPFVLPEDLPRLEAEVARAVTSHRVFSLEYRIRRRDGEVRWVLDRGRGIGGPGGAPTMLEGVVLDVSERKKVEDLEAMRQAELPYRLVSLATRDAVWDWDLLTDVMTWGEGFSALFGYERSAEVGTGAWCFAQIHPDDLARVRDAIHAVIDAGGSHWEAEHRFRHRDGHYVDVFDRGYVSHDDAGRSVRMVGAMRDVTAQHRVQVLEERLRLALANADLGTWDYDPVTGALHWDARWRELVGVSPTEAVSLDLLLSRMHPDDRVPTAAKMEQALQPGGTGDYDARYRILDGKGGERWLQSKGRVAFEHGRAVRFTGTVRDITDEVRAEETLRDADRRKNEFLAMLGHELRNPLSPILTALEIMRQKETSTAKEQDVIHRQIRHMVGLIDDLFDISRITRGKVALRKEILEIHSVVARAVEMARPLLEQRRHQLALDVPRTGLVVDGDPVRLAQVLANLLTNAAKYTGPGGHVGVRAWGEGEVVRIAVRDDGIGIPADLLRQIFEPFMQARQDLARGPGGLGLGLPLAQNLTRLHGGELVAHSAGPGLGSEFIVTLPRSSAAAEAPPARRSERPMNTRPRRILVVDDNEDSAFLLGELLRESGHEALVAYDGPSALALCEPGCPDIAIVDIGLPVMDGYELAHRLREQCGPGLRLIALTGYGLEADRQRALAAGFDLHLVKPIECDVLLRCLEPGPAVST